MNASKNIFQEELPIVIGASCVSLSGTISTGAFEVEIPKRLGDSKSDFPIRHGLPRTDTGAKRERNKCCPMTSRLV